MDPKDVQTHLRGLRRVLRRLGVLQGEASGPFAAQREFSDFIWLYTPVGGIYIPEATIGDEVAEGQRVGAIVDYFGEELSELKAPAEGRILFVETTPAIPDNGLILAVGKHLNAQEEKEEKGDYPGGYSRLFTGDLYCCGDRFCQRVADRNGRTDDDSKSFEDRQEGCDKEGFGNGDGAGRETGA